MSRRQGQASIELLAVLPVIALLAWATLQTVMAVRQSLRAERAGARAVVAALTGGDPVAVARAAAGRGAHVTLTGRVLTIHIAPPDGPLPLAGTTERRKLP